MSEVRKVILKDYETCPGVRTIQRYVANNIVGQSPLKMGEKGKVPQFIFRTLCNAFETMVRINQINGRDAENGQRKLSLRVNACMNKDGSVSVSLMRRILAETAVDLLCDKSDNAEDRRIMWTTYHNLKTWFVNWEKDLLDLGFAKKREATEGGAEEVYIPKDQLKNILNMDETCLSFDGSDGVRGGRPEAIFYDQNMPRLGKGTAKSGKTMTMIGGSTAAGEALPPHFQFQTAAQSEDTMRLNNKMLEYIPRIIGMWGSDEEHDRPISHGMNTKGGMDDEEFEKYMENVIFPLYPNARDIAGRRVMVKADSGPGRTCKRLLARMRHLGFYLYPGVPNTTGVSQETDRNYGPFKTQFRVNFDKIIQERIIKGKSTNMSPWMIGLVVFGGKDHETGLVIGESENAFEVGFFRDACLSAWAKIGAAPLTMKCLDDKKVRRQLGDADDSMNALMQSLQDGNHSACDLLTRRGYAGDKLRVFVKKVPKKKAVTKPNTLERQKLLAKASTHGEKFTATGGSHLTSDDMFCAMEIPVWEKEIKDMEKDKEDRVSMKNAKDDARKILIGSAKGAGVPRQGTFSGAELDTLLKWYQVPAKDVPNKPKKVEKWVEILDKLLEPPVFEEWTDHDEALLEELKTKELEIGDTALGRLRDLKKRELIASVAVMSKDELDLLQKEINDCTGSDLGMTEDQTQTSSPVENPEPTAV